MPGFVSCGECPHNLLCDPLPGGVSARRRAGDSHAAAAHERTAATDGTDYLDSCLREVIDGKALRRTEGMAVVVLYAGTCNSKEKVAPNRWANDQLGLIGQIRPRLAWRPSRARALASGVGMFSVVRDSLAAPDCAADLSN